MPAGRHEEEAADAGTPAASKDNGCGTILSPHSFYRTEKGHQFAGLSLVGRWSNTNWYCLGYPQEGADR